MPKKDKISAREKRELARQRKAHERQNRAYEKRKQKTKEAEVKNKEKAATAIDKTFGFLNGLIDLFVPSKSRTSHDRLIKQGVTFLACSVILVLGIMVSHHHYKLTEIEKARSASFMSSNLAWSKTNANVSTTHKPFMTQDRKTIFIPLKTTDMSQLNPDASDYHIFMMPKVDQTLDYRVESVQLVSFGSTGNMFIQVKTATPVKSQPVQFLIWSGTDLTNDKYNPQNDTDDAMQFVKVKEKYDSLSFSINLGGKGVQVIPQYTIKKERATRTVKDKNGKKQTETYVKEVKVPVAQNKDFYNDNRLAFIYNRIYQQGKVNAQIRKLKTTHSRAQISVNKIVKDRDALKRSGYNIPKLPDWALNIDNNASNGLPVDYDKMLDYNILHPDATFSKSVQKKIRSASLKDAAANQDSMDKKETEEEKFIDKLTGQTIKNKTTGTELTNTNGDNSDGNNASSTDITQWNELLSELQNLADDKTKMYHAIPINLYRQMVDFDQRTSIGSESNVQKNSGAITYSKMRGYNSHGRFMTIIGQPGTTSK